MVKSIEAIVKPELLTWARESIGLQPVVAAKKIGVDVEKLESWENGENRPTIAQLRKAANAYKRPLVAFYLPKPPIALEPLRDYRRIGEIEEREYSPALRLELRKARHRREVAIDILQELDEEIPLFEEKASIHDDPDVLSNRIRDLLGISIEEQFQWETRYQALNSWKNAVENSGSLVFQTASTVDSRIKLKEMRGVLMSEEHLPVILINSADAVNGKIFTLLHEFVHLLLHSGGVCDLEDYRNPVTDEERIEAFCNRVTGAALVPQDCLLSERIVSAQGKEATWTDYDLSRLASRFSVSKEVILRRFLILGRTTKDFYEKKRKEFLEQYEQYRNRKKSSGGPAYFRLVMRNNGLAYTKLVLEAYYQDYITMSEVSDYLGMKLKHFKKIEDEVMYMT